MSSPLHDALIAHLPSRHRRTSQVYGARITFNCPLCAQRGHRPDTRQRGAVFLNHDGGAGYHCPNCKFTTRQKADAALCANMKTVLEAFRMDSVAILRLNHEMWSAGVAARTAAKAPPVSTPTFTKQPLPSGAKPIGDWVASGFPDPNLNDVLADLAEMSEGLRNSYYWTPDPGESGDMNRRFIWLVGPANDPDGWGAHHLSTDEDAEVLWSDPNILHSPHWDTSEDDDN